MCRVKRVRLWPLPLLPQYLLRDKCLPLPEARTLSTDTIGSTWINIPHGRTCREQRRTIIANGHISRRILIDRRTSGLEVFKLHLKPVGVRPMNALCICELFPLAQTRTKSPR